MALNSFGIFLLIPDYLLRSSGLTGSWVTVISRQNSIKRSFEYFYFFIFFISQLL